MRIADDDVAVLSDAQPAGPAVAIIGGIPADAGVLAVAIERLDACRHIDDVESIVRPDGDGTRLDEFAILDTACLLYTSDAADERSSVDLGGRRIIKKK